MSKDETFQAEIDKVIKEIQEAVGSNVGGRDYFLLVPCASSKRDYFYETPNLTIRFKTVSNHSAQIPEVLPIDKPLSNFPCANYFDFIQNNQNHPDLEFAYKIYDSKKANGYARVYNNFKDNFFILSSLWGVIKADKKIPYYNIGLKTLDINPDVLYINQNGVPIYINNYPCFNDLLNAAQKEPDKPIVFLGTNDYIQRFIELSKNIKNKIILVHNMMNLSKNALPNAWAIIYANIRKRTNWHYEVMKRL